MKIRGFNMTQITFTNPKLFNTLLQIFLCIFELFYITQTK